MDYPNEEWQHKGATLSDKIITNNNFSRPNTVNLCGAYALEVSVGSPWSRVNS